MFLFETLGTEYNIKLFFPLNIRVGLEFPTIEVRYEHLNINAEAYVGSRGLPTFLNSIINVLEVLTSKFCGD